MNGHGAKFGRKKEEAIVALLSQRSIEEAARVTGIDTKTLLRWMNVLEFEEEYLEARRNVVGQAMARLQQATGAAATTLMKIMVDHNGPAASRVRAAVAVLDHAARGLELEDMDLRIRRLEQLEDIK